MNLAEQILRVLLVDDHPLMRDGLRAALRRLLPKARIEDSGTGREALEMLPKYRPHLVLLDVNLPGKSGLDVAGEIHALHPAAKLLIVAGEADPWAVRQAMAAGASGFITKTRTAACLGEAVQAVLQGGQFLCEDSELALSRANRQATPATEPPGPAILSEREREVVRYLAHGENTKSIAELLQISPKTVETHRQHIMRKLGTNNVAALARYAIRHGLVRP